MQRMGKQTNKPNMCLLGKKRKQNGREKHGPTTRIVPIMIIIIKLAE